ncbi:hypothetical protein F2Q68_00004919 [Brassica cretica]|uniref:Uncharacterized protein n=1 Tax=Brassica cretica TaxID=69181 RepID=A0A8S9J7Y5_BRACR|nr:hypothetical protein F2Q68_00004919 [Brassica cretica]
MKIRLFLCLLVHINSSGMSSGILGSCRILTNGWAGKPPTCKIHNFFLREDFLVIPSLMNG